MQFIDLESQINRLSLKLHSKMSDVLAHRQFINGPEVRKLEKRLCNYTRANHCVSCANGTDALILALIAGGVAENHVVFTTSFSFFATAEVIPHVGAIPYFVDIDCQTFNICPRSLETAIENCIKEGTATPKAVIAVNIFGTPCNYNELKQICKHYNLLLIEDAAQSFGSQHDGQMSCTLGDISTTSFFPAKPLGGFGDGGAIFCSDENIANTLRSLREHGKGEHKYQNVRLGFNSRLDTLQAAILLEKLTILDSEIEQRRDNVSYFHQHLNAKFQLQVNRQQDLSAVAQCSLFSLTEDRDTVLTRLKQHSVPYQIYYPTPLNQAEPMLQYPSSDVPNTINLCQQIFSIPCHAYLSDAEKEHIVTVLLETGAN